MTKVRLLTVLSLGTMLFASCEKEVEENIAPRSVAQASATTADLPGNWQLVAYKGIVPSPNTTDVKTTNIFAMLEDCKKDDQLHLEATGELTELPGATQCDAEFAGDSAEDTSAKPGSWALSDDQKTLTLTLGEAKEYQVVSLTSSTLKLRSAGDANDPYTELEYAR